MLVAHGCKRKNTNVERYKIPKEKKQNKTRENNQVRWASPGHQDDLMMSMELVRDGPTATPGSDLGATDSYPLLLERVRKCLAP